MAQIFYQINSGYPNFTAHIEPNIVEDQTHSTTGLYSFDNIPEGNYSITITDAIGCEAFFDNISITTTTTTTSIVYTPNFGLLYNYETVIDERNISSSNDFIVPTLEIVDNLVLFIGTLEETTGVELREQGNLYWDDTYPSFVDGLNTYSFNARGAGYRMGTSWDGAFSSLKIVFNCWADDGYHSLYSTVDGYGGRGSVLGTEWGLSIRLVNPNTLLNDGEFGTYTGNDGKVYQTICINGVEWLRYNLGETQFRNGDPIEEITDGILWCATPNSALCAYNNDWNNV